ncbi:MAG: YigZ family protein [Treponema sp.]|nr:YigZ family protein [Treponema sp.]
MVAPSSYASAELTVKGSRFLAELFPLAAQDEVRALLKAQKAKYADATHVVHAFIVGKHAEIMGMSDDGEPGGTAGRPVLDVMKGRDLTNSLLTVTRWFGGTLLGTGGLVHAYGDSAKLVLEEAVLEPLVDRSDFAFSSDYAQYQVLKKLLERYQVTALEEEFGEGVTVRGKIVSSEAESLSAQVFDVSGGKVKVEVKAAE